MSNLNVLERFPKWSNKSMFARAKCILWPTTTHHVIS